MTARITQLLERLEIARAYRACRAYASTRADAWWTRATFLVGMSVCVALVAGCGPAPGYEPRTPASEVENVQNGSEEPANSDDEATASAAPATAVSPEVALGESDAEYADTDPSALTEFKPALDGHGVWVEDATYGTLWVPSEAEVGTEFVPYETAGHWTYDDSASWVWVSDYSWGWAPFHYGRWVHVSRHGWAWIPGRTYAGAWVGWRTGAGYDYVGWAPLGPDWYWYNGHAIGWTFGYFPYYSYCHRDHLYDTRLGPYVVRGVAAHEHDGRTQPYVPARPSVGGSDRVVAAPGVGASGRVVATPRVGPRPAELGIKSESVARPPSNHAGLSRAQLLSAPHTAVAQGAQPPFVGPRSQATPVAAGESRAPYFGTRGSRALEGVARSPQVRGVSPRPPVPEPVYRGGGGPDVRASARVPAYQAPESRSFSNRSAPNVTSPPAYSSAPAYRSASPSSPSAYRSPAVSSAPAYRSPSVASAPAYRPPSVSAPSHAPSISTPSHASAPASRPSVSTPARSSSRRR